MKDRKTLPEKKKNTTNNNKKKKTTKNKNQLIFKRIKNNDNFYFVLCLKELRKFLQVSVFCVRILIKDFLKVEKAKQDEDKK